jgi:hypothetical protein
MGLSVLFVLSLTLLFIGVISVIIFGIGSIYMTQKILPQKYKLNGLSLILAIGFLLLFTIPLIIIFF